jgi:hypothetical protein
MEAVCSSETLISAYKYTRRYNPEDQHRHLRGRENLESHTCLYIYLAVCFKVHYLIQCMKPPFFVVSLYVLRIATQLCFCELQSGCMIGVFIQYFRIIIIHVYQLVFAL